MENKILISFLLFFNGVFGQSEKNVSITDKQAIVSSIELLHKSIKLKEIELLNIDQKIDLFTNGDRTSKLTDKEIKEKESLEIAKQNIKETINSEKENLNSLELDLNEILKLESKNKKKETRENK